jgi:hypothetical protein
MRTVDQVVFLVEYDTAYNGIAIENLRKCQATGLQSWYWMDQTSSDLGTGPPVLR